MSSFASLNTALSGLVAQRYGLDIAGQNIANVNTPGYSRQRVELQSINPSAAPQLSSTWDGPGAGVDVVDVARLTDAFVNARARAEGESAARLKVADDVWTRIDGLLAEPTDEGLTHQVSQFFSAWSDVTNRPDDDAARTAVVQSGVTVTDRLLRMGEDLANQYTQRYEDMGAVVIDINATSTAIADLNRTIQQSTSAGLSVNELKDRRDVLVDKLVALTGATVRDAGDSTVDVFVNGMAAVRGVTADTLSIAPTSAASLAAVRLPGGTVSFQWGGGIPASIPGGTISGTVEALTVTLPSVAVRLDAVALDMATQVNAIHSTGKGLDGVSGRAFFTGTTTATLTVAVTAQQVAAAAYNPLLPADQPLDGSIADLIAQLGEARTGPASTWRSAVTDFGASAQSAGRRASLQAVAVTEANAARAGVSGVDTDEELTRMISFQRAYEASARVLTSIDQALDVLINRTGLVGR